MQSILDLITDREAVTVEAITTLREQISKLTNELRLAETELADLVTTRTTLTRLSSMNEATMPDTSPVDNSVYQQIMTVFTTSDSTTMRAKDVCHALKSSTEPQAIEGIRAKLKRLVKRQILTEPEPGHFTLTTPRGPTDKPVTSNPDPNPNTKQT